MLGKEQESIIVPFLRAPNASKKYELRVVSPEYGFVILLAENAWESQSCQTQNSTRTAP